jgi:hypothetical protein
MKNFKKAYSCGTLLLFLFLTTMVQAQNTGAINRPATSAAGRTVLDPNGDGYTSSTTAGFAGNDVTNSELPYKSVPSFSIEPFGDLRRGPSHLYSDFVPDANSVGYYAYYDGTNLLFRMRMGSVMSGSKGYSVMLDTDGKFGSAGANADPNYVAATTGTNGNPGFEIEIVLETNFRIAIYNVDGTSVPALIKAYTNWQDMSQVSIAATGDNGDPDFLMDFYIPFSDLTGVPFNLSTSTPLRMSATTVMAPAAAIGGPKSDLYGLNDAGYKSTNDQYEAFINAQPSFTAASIGSSGSGFGSMCTAAPTVNSPIGTGTVNISGTWTMSSLSGAAGTTTVTVYKNGSSIGTVSNVASGTIWTLNNIALVNGDVITAKAQSAGESMCLVSNSVTAAACNSSNRPSLPVLNCYTTSKGITGTNLSTGWTIHIDNLTRSTTDNNLTNGSGLFAAPTGTSPNLTWNYSSGCSGGSPLTSGSYKVYYTDNVTGCASEPAYVCVAGNGGSALAGSVTAPVLATPANGVLTTATTSISGTTDANVSLYLYIDGAISQTTTASAGGGFTFPNVRLLTGSQVYIVAEYNTGAVGTSKCASQTAKMTVVCYTTPPVITVDNNGQITAGSPITGTSGEGAGATIKVYTSANTLVATTTVQANGSWSTGNAGTTPAAYNAVSGTTYYATAQSGSCGVSANSGNAAAVAATSSARCGSITGPVSAGATSVSGTLTGSVASTTVNLYLDGTLIGSASTSTSNWGPITVNTTKDNTLYANGILTIGVQESGKQEVGCSSSATAIACSSAPAAPVVSPANYTITQNQNITYTISNAVAGNFYGIADAATGQSLAAGAWATSSGNLSITTNTFNSSGTYNVLVKATSLSGVTVCTSLPAAATLAVSGVLPVSFLNISANKVAAGVLVNWWVANEQNVAHYEVERSTDCAHFETVGQVTYTGGPANTKQYGFTDPNVLNTTVCYRIKQVDIDGKAHYSSVIPVQADKNVSVRVAPNPATENATLYMICRNDGSAALSVMDANGQVVLHQKIQLRSGSNAVSLRGLSSLSKGSYFIIVESSDGVYHQKLLLQ